MKKRFEQTGLGERIQIEIDPNLIDAKEAFAEDGLKVPYEAVQDYTVIPKFYSKALPKIKITGSTLEKIDTITIAQGIGADSLKFNGEIVEITNEYVIIKKL
ncbi:MAG: hypothetical protein ABIF40_02910 [archaeon]